MVMEAVSLAFSVAQTLLATLQSSPQLKQLFSKSDCKSELESLKETVNTIKSVLLDAEAKDALSQQEINFVEKLKDAIYDADDLIDEFVTQAMQQQFLVNEGAGFSERVRILFSRLKKFPARHKIIQEIKNSRKRFDTIATDASKFCLKVNNLPIRRRREESCSDLYKDRIIGRDKELDEIVSLLLAPDMPRNNVSFLTIVGIGGLGKTALAKLVYHNEKIRKEFAQPWWICVADQDQRHLDLTAVLRKILELVASCDNHHEISLESVHSKLQKHLDEKKFLLFLDDVWNEDRSEWLKLEEFLMKGRKGSWVVLTSRSEETARIAGNGLMYPLKGLSEENSWNLFKLMSFEKCEKVAKFADFVDVGKKIVKKCAGVPLAIRVVGTLLYGQEVGKWKLLQTRGICSMGNNQYGIKSILEFSYHHLDSPLKSCFSYCAVFPKDFEIKKDLLIQLWMAQGYVQLVDNGQSLEEIAEDYFSILLRRSFFQDVLRDKYGDILSCKMHDLMHDFALGIAGKEIHAVNTLSGDLDENIRHLSLVPGNCEDRRKEGCGAKTKIRTLLTIVSYAEEEYRPVPHVTLANFGRLRVLNLCDRVYNGLDDSLTAIGKLVHLRYLDLSGSKGLKQLPGSITKLWNLQTLVLNNCSSLEVLPKDFCNLVNLRFLEIEGCRLMHMPLGMNKLTCLRKLTSFVVAEGSSSSVGQLKDLVHIPYLRGDLKIIIRNNARYVEEDNGEVGYLRNKEHLESIQIVWDTENENERADDEEELLEGFQPHPNLKKLELNKYYGVRIPRWMREEHSATSLPHLVGIHISGCSGFSHLPSFAKLPSLKSLKIAYLYRLEFMENTNSSLIAASTFGMNFFPSLEKLTLEKLPKLKGWWKGVEVGDDEQLPSFPCLSKLVIKSCRVLSCTPLCPTVERLTLERFRTRLQPVIKARSTCTNDYIRGAVSYSSYYQLRYVITSNVGYLKSLPIEAFESLVNMRIDGDEELESLTEAAELLQSCSSSLRELTIDSCRQLRSLFGEQGGLGLLTALEKLILGYLKNLDFSGEDDNDDNSKLWSSMSASLHHMELCFLPKLVNLPKGMQQLTALQTIYISNCSSLQKIPDWIGVLSSLEFLTIHSCPAIESMPESMRELTSLRALEIWGCSFALKQRCQNPNGEDWPKIQHIPIISGLSIV